MAAYAPIKLQYNPITTYAGTTQNSYVGAQSTSGQRGVLPSFNDGNSYFIASTGNDSNAGTSASPKKTIQSLFATNLSYNDNSGNGYNLTGTPGYAKYPCNPIPPQGDWLAGPFSDTQYLAGPAGLLTALSGKTQWAVEGYLYVADLSAVNTVWSWTDGSGQTEMTISTLGAITFKHANNTTSSTSANGTVAVGNWYYFCCTFQSSTLKKVYIGTTPETASAVVSTTPGAYTTGTVNSFDFGRSTNATALPLTGYLDRLVISSVVRSSFPISPTASNITAFYEMETRPLMQTAPKSYIVIKDSASYDEGLYANFPYDITAGFGIYAADGQAPTFQLLRGAKATTYGAGNSLRAVLTSSAATTCYVSKAGNDGTGARGNPALPFLTIQAAITATTTTGDTVEIQDSGTYTETLTLPNRSLTLQSSASVVPVIMPAGSGSIFTNSAGINTFNFSNILFNGKGNGFFNNGATTFVNFYDCTFQNFSFLVANNAPMTSSSCYFTNITASHDTTGHQNSNYATNCYYYKCPSIYQMMFDHCTVDFAGNNAVAIIASMTTDPTAVGTTGTYSNMVMHGGARQCILMNGSATVTGGASKIGQSFALWNSRFSNFSMKFNTTSTLQLMVEGMNMVAGNNFSTYGVDVSNTGGNYVKLKDSVAIGYTRGFYLEGATGSSLITISNLTTVRCATAGVDSPAAANATGLADNGSGVAYQGGLAPTLSYSSVNFLSTTPGSENVTISSGDAAVFNGDTSSFADAGVQSKLFRVHVQGVVVNGLILAGSINEEGGMGAGDKDFGFTCVYSTFSGLGTYGIKAGAQSTIAGCLFNTNGHAIKIGTYSVAITVCAGYLCGGDFFQNYGRNLRLSYSSSWSCAHGEYDNTGSYPILATALIYSQSSVYDYAGDAQLTYSCVGTLDPTRGGSLDANSNRVDPLYRNPMSGDLRLQVLEAGYYYNSPAKQTGPGAVDMGAFSFTYGAASTTWTTIDFATSGYRNPDKVRRHNLAVKLAEGDKEDGSIYSAEATIKLEYEMTWASATSDMPRAQLAALLDMFNGSSNQVQMDVGDGRGYISCSFARAQGFEYEDLTQLYSDNSVPMPLKTLVIREN